jgi:hypothetical protein
LNILHTTYNDSKRENIRGLVEFTFEMCFWTSPVFISSKHTFNTPTFGKVGGILKVNDLNTLNNNIFTILFVFDYDIVWFDIYTYLALLRISWRAVLLPR